MTNNELPAYYTVLFSAAADALEAMEQQNFGTAKERLLQGMQQAEELYLEEKKIYRFLLTNRKNLL